MPTNPETQERAHLQTVLDALRGALDRIDTRLGDYARDIQKQKDYLWEHRADMDHVEKISNRQSIEQALDAGEALLAHKKRLHKLLSVPYFGRVDFRRQGEVQAMDIYVGVHAFEDEAAGKTLIYDWRAPIASLFYDYETGPARYAPPAGEVAGEITLKRQFRIRDGVMEFMLETALNILDDVLQKTLSQAADTRMKGIVATIQRDQNAIIRNEDAHTLIIQGVAGSGKTSIALHRIAYLLYRFKDSLSSDDILIISPNRVFADYIGNVLPELGEEQVLEIGMETLAAELLDHQYRFQSFFEQTAQLLEKNDEALKARITTKATPDFLRQIDRYADELEQRSFVAAEWRTGRKIVPDWFFAETWARHRGVPLTERVARVVAAAEQQIGIHYNHDLEVEERRSLREAIRAMVCKITLRQAYQGLFEWLEQPELFKLTGGKLEYADVFPLIYLKMRLEGITNPYSRVKHLLIDEMQDYTPVQYAVLGRLFSCRKTVLGDATQSVNPYTSSNAEQIRLSLQSATSVKLTKSYRSTWEIMQFALAISPNPELEAMKRHGEVPQVIVCKRPAQMIAGIADEIAAFNASGDRSLAIIAKTQKQAARLHKSLLEAGHEARLLDGDSVGFSTGVIVCTAHLAKGLEFDRVIVADAGAGNYLTEMDRNLLYVACTRAMHRLTLFTVGAPAEWLPTSADLNSNRDL